VEGNDLGCFLNGSWTPGEGVLNVSHDPARGHALVWSGTGASSAQVDAAVMSARGAFEGWADRTPEERAQYFDGLQDLLDKHADRLADAMISEMGKPLREARAEAGSLAAKVRVSAIAREALPDFALPNAPGESRWRPLGPMGVIGPYNYPVHLLHTHVAPALLAGNTVVVKPSEVTPLTGQIYGEIMAELGLPDGVFNLVQGGGEVGAALAGHPGCAGLAFTGSWATGRRILEANLDHPHKLVALEMGGRNVAVVLDDADLHQAVHELVVGCCLTTGQRCTATSRVVVQAGIAPRLMAALVRALGQVRPGDPREDDTLMGPLASEAAQTRYIEALDRLATTSAVPLLAPSTPPGGAWVTPSLHQCTSPDAGWRAYIEHEFFGPDLALEVVADAEEALERVRWSPYGLSMSVFTANEAIFEWFVARAPAGIFNWNRSTNNASGLLPFGGVGRSGNFRPAGSTGALYCAHSIAVLRKAHGVFDADPRFGPIVHAAIEE